MFSQDQQNAQESELLDFKILGPLYQAVIRMEVLKKNNATGLTAFASTEMEKKSPALV